MKRRVVSGTMLTLLFMGMLTLTLNIQSAKAEPTTITVPDDYAKIQWAIGNASVGDTIFVRAGTYYERVHIGKSLSLVGENKSSTFIDGEGTASPVIGVFAHNVTIRGFTIRNSRLEGYFTDSGIYVLSVENTTIVDNIISANINGIELYGSRHDTVNGNTIFENDLGISAWNETGGSFIRNTISNNVWSGIGVSDSNAITILNNSVTSDYIALTYSNDIIIAGNMVSDSLEIGVNLWYSNSCSIYENTISDSQTGIHFVHCQENKIHHNNFLNNSKQVYLEFCEPSNVWDDGYPSGGNYWSDYDGTDQFSGSGQDQPLSDGIGDTQYPIDGNNQDNYPLMNPWVERKVGVKPGDWAKYKYEFSWSSTDPTEQPPPGIEDLESLTVTVLDVYDTTITFQQVLRLKNGTETEYTWVVDVNTGLGNGTYQLAFFSANLSVGDRLNAPYPGLPIWCGWQIRETVLRTYVGFTRETNHLNVTNWSQILPLPLDTESTDDFYWDRATGILSERAHKESRERESYTTSLSLKVKIVDTNLWKAPLPTTLGELKTEIEELGSEGEIDKQGIVKSLIAKLDVTERLVDIGRVNKAKMVLECFIIQVQKLTSIRITVDAADILIQSAEYILSQL